MFTRRGFLSLVGTSFAAAYAAKVLPAPPAPLPRPRFAEPVEVQIQCLPFSSELDGFQQVCEPGGIVNFVARVQRPFLPQRLMFSACNLDHFELMPFVGDDGVADLAHPVPASVFGPTHWGMRLLWSPARVGDEIVLSLRNVSDVESEVRGVAMVGKVLV